MSDPVHILIVPASFTPAPLYEALQQEFAGLSIESSIVALPSVIPPGATVPSTPPTLEHDTEAVYIALQPLLSAGKRVTILGHSYGGIPGTQVLGHAKINLASRTEAGLGGGVERIVYVASPLPEVGRSVADPVADPLQFPPGPELDFIGAGEDGYLFSSDARKFAAANLNELSAEEALSISKGVGRQSAVSFAGNLTYAGWQDVDVVYVGGKKDLIVPLGRQRSILGYLGFEKGWKGVRGLQLEGGHCPMFVNGKEFAETIQRLLQA